MSDTTPALDEAFERMAAASFELPNGFVNPALRTALFYGAIRDRHAVRAVDAVDTPPRRGELARALGYWVARYRARAVGQLATARR